MSDAPPRARAADRLRGWLRDAALPLLTLGVFAAGAGALWLNAIINPYRFNVAVAVLGSIPTAVLLSRGAGKARDEHRRA